MRRRKLNKNFVILVVFLLVIAVGAVAAMKFLGKDDSTDRKDDNKPQLNAEFSSQLRMFMTTRFGKPYCDALYLAHMQEAEEERKNTRSYRNSSRKGY